MVLYPSPVRPEDTRASLSLGTVHERRQAASTDVRLRKRDLANLFKAPGEVCKLLRDADEAAASLHLGCHGKLNLVAQGAREARAEKVDDVRRSQVCLEQIATLEENARPRSVRRHALLGSQSLGVKFGEDFDASHRR